jgi:hypothetical protein
MSIAAMRARILAAIGCAVVGCGGKRTTVEPSTTNATPPALTVPAAPPGAVGLPVLAHTTGLPEPVAPWPSYTTSKEGCIPASAPEGAPKTLPAPFERCLDPLRESPSKVTRFSPATTAAKREADPNAEWCCYVTFTQTVPHYFEGRPLVGARRAIAARAVHRCDWLAEMPGIVADARAFGLGVEQWRRRAAREHASIAAFSRASLALLAYGAPPNLLTLVHRAAIDEIEHARIAYAIAAALSGDSRGPGPLDVARADPIPTSLAELAAETFRDGCVSETRSALEARREARAAREGPLRRALMRIADDEERHAELAWRVVDWALREGKEAAARAVRAELASAARHDDAMTRGLVVPCAEALLQKAAASIDALR